MIGDPASLRAAGRAGKAGDSPVLREALVVDRLVVLRKDDALVAEPARMPLEPEKGAELAVAIGVGDQPLDVGPLLLQPRKTLQPVLLAPALVALAAGSAGAGRGGAVSGGDDEGSSVPVWAATRGVNWTT